MKADALREKWLNPPDPTERQAVKLTSSERKKRSDATVAFMIAQYQGRETWADLSVVFYGKTLADCRRFYFEMKRVGIEVVR